MVSILEQLSVRGYDGRLFVLGSFHRDRVTVMTQQVRALELIEALEKQPPPAAPPPRLLVVGAGFAGLTAAAAAGHLGWKVVLLERAPGALTVQRGCCTRWIYPYIRDWPEEHAVAMDARLPLLDWKAGTADWVADQVLSKWEQRKGGRIREVYRVRSVTIKPGGDALEAHWTTADHTGAEIGEDAAFTYAVLATGFGAEDTIRLAPRRSYWRNDATAQTEIARAAGVPRKFLISGTGDGALIDLLRVRIGDFKEHELLELLSQRLGESSWSALIQRIGAIELEAARVPERASRILRDAYATLVIPDPLLDAFRTKLRADTEVEIVHRGEYWATLQAQPLNRFLVLCLQRTESRNPPVHTTFRAGDTRFVEPSASSRSYRVELAVYEGPREVTVELDADDVLIRHGGQNPLTRERASTILAADRRPLITRELEQELLEQAAACRGGPSLKSRAEALRRYPLFRTPLPILGATEAASAHEAVVGRRGVYHDLLRFAPDPNKATITVVHGRWGAGKSLALLRAVAEYRAGADEAAYFIDGIAAASDAGARIEGVLTCLELVLERRAKFICIDELDRQWINHNELHSGKLAEELLKKIAEPRWAGVVLVISLNHRLQHCEPETFRGLSERAPVIRCPEVDPDAPAEWLPARSQAFLKVLSAAASKSQIGLTFARLQRSAGFSERQEIPAIFLDGGAESKRERLAPLSARSTKFEKNPARFAEHFYDRDLANVRRLKDLLTAPDVEMSDRLAHVRDEKSLPWLELASDLVRDRGLVEKLGEVCRYIIELHRAEKRAEDEELRRKLKTDLTHVRSPDGFAASNIFTLMFLCNGQLGAIAGEEPIAHLNLRGVQFFEADLSNLRFHGVDLSTNSHILVALKRPHAPKAQFFGCTFAGSDVKRSDRPELHADLCAFTDATIIE